MRIAFAGKGGAGKSSLAGTLARVLARDGHDVLAIDDDPSPNLALSLGVPSARALSLAGLPADLIVRDEDGYHLTKSVPEIVTEFGHDTPDGVRLLIAVQPKTAGGG